MMTCIHHKIHEIYENVVTIFTHKRGAVTKQPLNTKKAVRRKSKAPSYILYKIYLYYAQLLVFYTCEVTIILILLLSS